ncbi:MAG: aminotransferase class III-fold pyridoxal phosphate-dependent enzyme [Pseudomonadales bacterium]|nr:aminotransferase class III-fold pyridoxal phosphate-dependent enzyme [Pseudomonadales bacterium]MCP5214494.1 aminotransferase class III-fold pyridoxal phosphate-dependent enzyme [Pseudomonadales bacterium]MCP5302941.1 aminotransferase class III-fold pyridoxal phosphate-dependent enzyme [Pseudomonadales bacterium]
MNAQNQTLELQALDKAHHLHPFTDIKKYQQTGGRIISRAEHIYIYDTDGNQILDGMSGLWCCNLGYSQTKIFDAINEQLHKLPFYNNFFNCSNEPSVTMAKALVDVTPSQFNHVFFTNSGSEANDTNIKLVHRYFDLLGKPEKKHFIGRINGYHGSTIASSSLGGMDFMHKQYTGLDYVHHIGQPHWFKEGGELSRDEFGLKVARELEQKIDEIGEHKIAAFIAEPIQGSGGVIVPPKTYWPEIQRICNEREILLISDEVICGFGRTGNWFGCETYGIKPDLLTFAKGVSNGYQPLGGVMVSDKIADVLSTGSGDFAHGLTYSGHPVACAAGIATINILREEKIIEKVVADIAPYLERRWKELADHPLVGEARVKGMVAALELVSDKSSREKLALNGEGALFCRDTAIANGLMVRAVGDAIISAPPVICSKQEIDTLIERLLFALDATAAHYNIR